MVSGPRRLPTSRREWQALINTLDLRPSKGLGQHFLFERGVVQRMVRMAGVGADDLVLEIGPGLGILTSELLGRARQVTAIELDGRLAAHLRDLFCDDPRLQLVQGNALEIATADVLPVGEPFTVVANLPYAVGAAILRHLLEQERRPQRLTVMLQMEVAQRIVAEPPAMSVLGIATRFYAEPRIGFNVPPTVFIPPPTVESAIAILNVREEPPLPSPYHERFFRIVNAGFRQRRKQVANSLASELPLPKEIVTDWLSSAGINPSRRPQTLELDEWVALTVAAPDIETS